MIETKDITKMVAHIVRRDNGIPDANIMHPMREWVLGLVVVLLLVIGGMIFNIMMYTSYHDALTAPVAVVETAVPYKSAQVSQAITYYEAERKVYESISGSRSVTGQVPGVASTTIATSTEAIPVDTQVVPTASTTPATSTENTKPIVPTASSTNAELPQPAG